MKILEFHEVANLFPLMEGDEYEALCDDIKANGLLDAIWMHPDGSILDGRNRYRACLQTNTEPRFDTWRGADELEFVLSKNLHRRHLNESQRAMIAARLANAPAHRPEISSSIELLTQPEAASRLNISVASLKRAAVVQKEATPEIIEAIDKGELAVSKAVQQIKRQQKTEELNSVSALAAKEWAGVYDVVVIDPPWPMEKIERDVAPEQVAFEYPTMTEDELYEIVPPLADDCHVWLWATHKHLPLAMDLLYTWGVKYICTFVWHKSGGFQPFGLPQYNCEFALYGRKGTPFFTDFKDFKVCFDAPRGAHSEKPEYFYDMVRRVTAGRRLDMYNRRAIDGFDGWGKESP